MNQSELLNRRQVLYWRMLSTMFGYDQQGENFDSMSHEIAQDLALPESILHPTLSLEQLFQRYPELEPEFNLTELDDRQDPTTLRRSLIISKLLLNVFGPQTQKRSISAAEYAQWLKDVAHLERCLGFQPGALRQSQPGQGQASQPGGLQGGQGVGSGFNLSEEELRQVIQGLEKDLIKRMALREVLQDNRLAAQLTPSMAVVEQLLRDKSHLSGNALINAKRLIKQYVDELADVLRLQVMQAVSAKIDRSVPPKRVFRNLDLKRTIWRNLTNWNSNEGRLYVDRLYYRQTAKKRTPMRMIVVVDQSGSMVDAMVQCTILASIFAGLPHVDMHLIAFDTRMLDLTPWVHDPFEVLLRTQLGGGTSINEALLFASEKIQEPRKTAVVLITDFYEGGSDQVLLDTIKAMIESGVHFIPVGAVTSSGYFSVNDWFRTKLKEMGRPIFAGSPRKLIEQIKQFITL
ncbi:MAG TPA: VWA domain-containing protein [Herpetosiphon sp.]|uniref:VWA containing CoxE family protein n=1 Tax=Herpetosiphon aurantiacus (strain ATCC 23779 / DSM 785 / 114-95) TaxID=316274 RepID=A9B2Y1_HERA2|nr:VWA domain-containing protein [Herpetosiphon sp.]ABX06044.1 VWA containing CoxE family protein [Herpetosiphon aurantiacus DSM 785]HBW50637.1 VWA domain-containing protein [Herpetosiphon sp.]